MLDPRCPHILLSGPLLLCSSTAKSCRGVRKSVRPDVACCARLSVGKEVWCLRKAASATETSLSKLQDQAIPHPRIQWPPESSP